jgi:5-methylcytosine-specific restriction endonuclease McrA
MTRDKRYGTRRWKATRLRVLHRDLWACFVPGCGVSASVADHIDPVYPGMPSAWFFDEANLRAACRHHNLRRGHVAQFERELAGEPYRSSVTQWSCHSGPALRGSTDEAD